MDGRIYYIQQRLISDLSKHWRVEEMAAMVRLSPPHFHRLFRNTVGISPMKYLHDLRLDAARELLENTFLQIKEIGHRTGLRDPAHLCLSFKDRFGSNPLQHRKQFWQTQAATNGC